MRLRTEGRVSAWAAVLCMGIMLVIVGCPPPEEEKASDVTILRRLPLDTMSVALTGSDVQFDPNISSDGNGSLRVTAGAPMTVRIYEIGSMAVDNARLIYQARVRTADVKGSVFLEMWCRLPDEGARISRGRASALSGTTAWTVLETPIVLERGKQPDNVGLNLVVDGTGTAWIDDIRLLRAPLGPPQSQDN